ncbi:MAG: FAD-binding oxidoreductase [Desulfobacterales bacterium]|nr:FAD-binding oxidoreductase [Desulfobacterales bacterium]
MEPYLRALADSKYASFWLDQDDRPETLSPLTGDECCRLLIVGGGFTGLWAALQAKERMPDLDIILIESTTIGDGASGRNGGMLSDALSHGDSNAEYHFPGEVDLIDKLGIRNLEELLGSLERYNIDARYDNVGHMTVAINEGQVVKLRQKYERKKAAGADNLWLNQNEVRKAVNSPMFLAGTWWRDSQGGTVDPARLCWGLKETILSLGVRIFEGTSLIDMAPHESGMKATCANGTITCDKILMGTNGFPNPIRRIRKTAIPVWDYQMVTEPLTPAQLESISWGTGRHYALSDASNMFHYFRMTQDKRITWGGGGSVCYFYGNRTDQGVADDRGRFEGLSRSFFKTFPQLEGLRFTHRWSGIIASTTRFCMVPGVDYDGRVSWAIGYTGLGVGASRFGARIGFELLGYQPSEILDMQFVRKKAINWPPEPIRWIGVTMSRHAMTKADANNGKRGLWLKILDKLNLGFAC